MWLVKTLVLLAECQSKSRVCPFVFLGFPHLYCRRLIEVGLPLVCLCRRSPFFSALRNGCRGERLGVVWCVLGLLDGRGEHL